jgi:hypothetical protein
MKYIKSFDEKNLNLEDIFSKKVENIPNLKNFYLYSDENNLTINDAIDSLPIINIDLSILSPTKYFLCKEKVNKMSLNLNSNLPFIFKDDNIYYIIDGHHRITKYILTNKKYITVRIFDNDVFTSKIDNVI